MTQKKLILHIGFPKTATTSIQETLSRGRDLLEEQGIHYPRITRSSSNNDMNHEEVLLSLFSERSERLHAYIKRAEEIEDVSAANAAYRDQFEMLFARKDCIVLISADNLPHQPQKILKKIESAIQKYGWSIEVIASVRSPLSDLASTYSEITKSIPLAYKKLPDYRVRTSASRRLENLRSVFDTVRTYPFSEACRHPRGPVGYFLDFLGVENAGAFELIKANEGLSNNAIRLLAYINRFESLILNGRKNPNRSERDLAALWTVPGPKFRLTREEYEMVREHIEFENAWLESNLGREYCDDEIELRRSDVHWDEESLRAVRNALPNVPGVLVPYVHRYFEEERGLVLTQGAAGPKLLEYCPALERSEEAIRSVEERLRAGQLSNLSAVALLRSAISGNEGDRRLYDHACELLLQSGKSQEAIQLAEEGLARLGGDLALMSRLGYAYEAWGGGGMERALVQWARVRQAHPSAEAGWIEGAMCSASLGYENEAGKLLGTYLAQLDGRLSWYWWNRALLATKITLLGYSEDRHVRCLLEALFLRSVGPDLSAHLDLFLRMKRWTVIMQKRRGYQESKKLLGLLREIYPHSPIRSDAYVIALELALGIAVERENSDRIRQFVTDLSFEDFYKIFNIRCLEEVQSNFLFKRDDIHEIIAALPVTDPDNAKKCLVVRYALGMDYGAAYEALTGSLLPTRREGYSDFAFASYAGNGRPKVAFCVSGQLRGYREAFASWRKSRLFVDCDVSIFVHTWPEIGATSIIGIKASRVLSGNFMRACIRENIVIGGPDNFKKAYPNLIRAVTNPSVVSAAELIEFYETPHVVAESEKPYRDYTNAEKMYYKIQACWELACASGEEFHFVFRVRPDLALHDDSEVDWREIVAQSQNKRIAYVEFLKFYQVGLAVGDELGFGNPAAMALYGNTWSHGKDSNNLISAYLGHDRWYGHTQIALNLVEHEVRAMPFPERFVVGGLVDAKKPSLESLRGALEKDLTPDQRRQNPLWQALCEDISHKIEWNSTTLR